MYHHAKYKYLDSSRIFLCTYKWKITRQKYKISYEKTQKRWSKKNYLLESRYLETTFIYYIILSYNGITGSDNQIKLRANYIRVIDARLLYSFGGDKIK